MEAALDPKKTDDKRVLALGLDLGTTSICGAVIDSWQNQMVEIFERPNNTNLISRYAYESLQDADALVSQALDLIDLAISSYPDLQVISVTGQMHGILYINAEGEAVSPLITWQDKRGDLSYQDALSYCEYLTSKTKYPMASGFGLVTHFYNLVHQQIPENASKIVTIMDYLTMRLAGQKTPVSHCSNAASLGCFNLDTGSFDADSLRIVSIDPHWLPAVTDQNELIGCYRGIPVSVALGDNQASFLGAVSEPESSVLVNIGTGSQLSVMTNSPIRCGLEARPYLQNKVLLAGSSLCGGRAYAVIERFFREIAVSAGAPDRPLYPLLNQLAEKAYDRVNQTDPDAQLIVSTQFCGTRANPSVLGSIQQISDQNLTPENMVYAALCGIAHELFQFYQDAAPFLERKPRYLVASGNAVRKNKVLQQVLAKTFGMTVVLPKFLEEASCGAALFGLACLSSED